MPQLTTIPLAFGREGFTYASATKMSTADQAAVLTRIHWEDRRPQILEWLHRVKKFRPDAAEKAFNNFVETMVFVAGETGIIQYKMQKPWL